jgi:hypothetical protein
MSNPGCKALAPYATLTRERRPGMSEEKKLLEKPGPAELRKLTAAERDAIMQAAALAEDEYRNNPELTAFDAFGKDDLYVDQTT